MDLWNGGGALEGRAPDEVAVREFARDLKQSGEVRSAQVARIQRNESGVAEYRVMVNFLCAAPGERSVCLPAPGISYTQQQIEAALRPVLAPEVQAAQIELASDATRVLVKGRASEADAQAALERAHAAPLAGGLELQHGQGRIQCAVSHGVHRATAQPGHLHHRRRRALSSPVAAPPLAPSRAAQASKMHHFGRWPLSIKRQ